MYIAVDFDGTCVKSAFPNIGMEIGASFVLKELVKNGHKIILYTMRGKENSDGVDELQPTLDWFKKHDIELFGVNENNADLGWWTDSKKVFADLYIDDLSWGVPKVCNTDFVDWLVIYQQMYWNTTTDYVEHIDYKDFLIICNKIQKEQKQAMYGNIETD